MCGVILPYIAKENRPALDLAVGKLADKIVNESGDAANNRALAKTYADTILSVVGALEKLESGEKTFAGAWTARELVLRQQIGAKDMEAWALAKTIFDETKKDGQSLDSVGLLNYSLTRFIQEVPEKMVKEGKWKEEFRYWTYAATISGLGRAEYKLQREADSLEKELDSVEKSLRKMDQFDLTINYAGVLRDVKDEYKRRVNTAYEAVQIEKSGDCYTTQYRTEVVKLPDGGFKEVMRDFRKKTKTV